MTALDLSALPPPAALDTLDFEAIRTALLADIVGREPALAPALALEVGATVRQVEATAYRELTWRADGNSKVRAVMLATATGADLDNAAANLGVVRLPGELDAALRARAADSFSSSSVAGPRAAYRRLALNVDAVLTDAEVTSPTPGVVRVALLTSAPDGVAAPELVARVQAALSADDVRPLTDFVQVVPATVIPYDVTAVLHLASLLDAATIVSAASAAVRAYGAARRALGRGVAVKGIDACLMQAGVDNVDRLSPPADIPAAPGQAAYLRTLTITTVLGGGGV